MDLGLKGRLAVVTGSTKGIGHAVAGEWAGFAYVSTFVHVSAMSGQYSSATVRGTKWLVQDSCAGTLTRVANGVVSVNDQVRHKTITLRAGKKYLARPRR